MRIIHLCHGDNPQLEDGLKAAGFEVTSVPYAYPWEEGFRKGFEIQPVVDAVVCSWEPGIATIKNANPDQILFNPAGPGSSTLCQWLRKLPDEEATADGRRLNKLPLVVILERNFDAPFARLDRDPIYLTWFLNKSRASVDEAASSLHSVISKYWQTILLEFEQVGFLVRYDGGRFQLGPAYKKPLTGGGRLLAHWPYAPNLFGHFVTLDRDAFGIQADIDQFEELIGDSNVTENKIQRFLEDHPYFLDRGGLFQALPQLPFRDSRDRLLVPDFILKPLAAYERDINWEVLDLKRPQVPLLVGRSRRRRLSAEIHTAIRQLRDYAEYFADPGNAQRIASVLGHSLRFPRLAVLVGRLPKDGGLAALNDEQQRTSDVRLVTYDELLESQKVLL